MLWIKALHLIALISWMAELLYLPRLFVNWVEVSDQQTRERLILMMHRLQKLGHVAMLLTLVFGIWLLGRWVGLIDGYFSQAWLHVKLTLVLGLVIYQVACGRITRQLASGKSQRTATWFRWFNEIPALIMIGIVLLVVVKPF